MLQPRNTLFMLDQQHPDKPDYISRSYEIGSKDFINKSLRTTSLVALTIGAFCLTSVAGSGVLLWPWHEDDGPTLPVHHSHHLIIGKQEPGDRLVYSKELRKPFLLLGKKLIKYVEVNLPENVGITRIVCLDQATDGTGAKVFLVEAARNTARLF